MSYILGRGTPFVMPTLGPLPVRGTTHYGDWLALQMRYVTDPEALAALLPHPFIPAREPVVTIGCMAATQIEFMAGRGYNIVAVDLAAEFHGEKDHCVGSYAVVLWENDAIPIILGREMLGAPKLYADIPEPRQEGDRVTFECSLFGNEMIEVVVSDLSPVPPEALKAVEQELNSTIWMGWKYIPRADLTGPDVSYATTIPVRYQLREGWIGRGSHKLYETKWEDVLFSQPAMEALKTLPVIEYRDAVVARGSSDLLLSESRRLE